jgi:hypothetical protein
MPNRFFIAEKLGVTSCKRMSYENKKGKIHLRIFPFLARMGIEPPHIWYPRFQGKRSALPLFIDERFI